MLVRVFLCPFCARDRGCSAHPAFPAPSCFLGVKIEAKLGRIAPRGCGRTPSRCLKVESATRATNSTSSLRTQGPITTTVSDVAKPSNNVFLLQAARRDGVDGPLRHQLCQNEVVANLRQGSRP